MPNDVIQIKILLSSPSNLSVERKIFPDIISDVNQFINKILDLVVVPVQWENDSYPAVGEYPQKVIMNQLPVCDMYVGLLGDKFGTPTPISPSGTVEEYREYYHLKKNIIFYFKDEEKPIFQIDPSELQKVIDFQKQLSLDGVLYGIYTDPEELRRKLCNSIYCHIIEFVKEKGIPSKLLDNKLFLYYFKEGIRFLDLTNSVMIRASKNMISKSKSANKYVLGFNNKSQVVARLNVDKFIEVFGELNSELSLDNNLIDLLFSLTFENLCKSTFGYQDKEEILQIIDSATVLSNALNSILIDLNSYEAQIKPSIVNDKKLGSTIITDFHSNLCNSIKIFSNCLLIINDFKSMCENLIQEH